MNLKLTNSFKDYHPTVNFMYFISVILFTLMFNHPAFLALGFIGSITYSAVLNGWGKMKGKMIFIVSIMLSIIIINPLVNHKGMTILFYLNDKPMTLEAFLYGVATAFIMANMIMWFSCYNKIITSDKFIYLFSRRTPYISLLISMTLGLVPRLKNQLNKIRVAQRSIGRDINNGSLLERIEHGCRIISILITWALENGIQTADSMRARGYGTGKRTSFAIFKIQSRDKKVLAFMTLTIIVSLTGYFLERNVMIFYPAIFINEIAPADFIIYVAYGALLFLPIILEFKEAINWRLLESRI